jgi:hypothetical protein
LESWLLALDVPVLVGAAVGSLNLNVVDGVCVAVVSIAIPPDDDDALEACAELGGGLAVVPVLLLVLVLELVCNVLLTALVELAV